MEPILISFEYDAQGWRIEETAGGTTRDFFFSDDWQVLEERVGGTTRVQYVWSPVYVDAMIERDWDSDSNGSLETRHYVQQDANWNVTALFDVTSGSVAERYVYDPYGNRTDPDSSWSTDRQQRGELDAWASRSPYA